MNLSKRVIILDKINSPLIAQAIFILRDENVCEFSAVAEAEKIVTDYLTDESRFQKKRPKLPVILISLGLWSILMALVALKLNF